jgi:hypothetical protein
LYVVGQAGLTFRTRYNEHNREIQANGKTSKYAQHILNMTHNYDTIGEHSENITSRKKRKNVII